MEEKVELKYRPPVLEEKIELMYRPPGREHVNITEALDELFGRVDKLEEVLLQLADAVEKLSGTSLSEPDQ